MIKNFEDFLNEQEDLTKQFSLMKIGDLQEGLLEHEKVIKFFRSSDLILLGEGDENEIEIDIRERIEDILNEKMPKYTTSLTSPNGEKEEELIQYYVDPFPQLDKLVKVIYTQHEERKSSGGRAGFRQTKTTSYLVTHESLKKLLHDWRGKITGTKYGI